jgi:hypothetical protein
MARGVNRTPDFARQEQRRQARFSATAATKGELCDGQVPRSAFRSLNLIHDAPAPAEAYFGPPHGGKWPTGVTPGDAFGPTLIEHRAEPWAACLLDRYGVAEGLPRGTAPDLEGVA